MNKYVSCVIRVMACAASVEIWAQAPTPPGPQPAPANARRYVILGCVSRETPSASTSSAAPSPQFVITDTRGDEPVVYRLDGDVSELTFHVGHTVEISGPLVAGPAGANGPNAKAPVLKVSALTYLSTTCKSLKP